MSNRLPEIDQWYQHLDKGQPFCVIALDPIHQTIVVQNFEGDTDEYSFAEWRELAIEPGAQPESWTGALDITEKDDLGTEVTDTRKADWDTAAQEYRQVAEDEVPGSGDDYGEGYMKETVTPKKERVLTMPRLRSDKLGKAAAGIITEAFNAAWRAEYSEDPASGLWRAEVFKHDVPEWCEIDLESLDEARECARNFYAQL